MLCPIVWPVTDAEDDPMPISNDLVGTRLPGATYRWDGDDAIVYALGVGARPPAELHLLDENRGPAVLPSLALVANWWAMKDVRSVLDTGGAPMVHASQSVELERPLQPAGEVRVEAEVAAVWDKGRGSIVELTGTGTDADGVLFRTRSATMVIGVGGWGGERGPSSAPADDPGPPDVVHDDHVRAEQAAVYRLSGDRNPLHIDPEAARAAGFDDVFLHGLCTLGFAARAVILACAGGDPARLRAIGCRFSMPVYLDRPLRTEMWRRGDGRVAFRTLQGPSPALTAGLATVTSDGG
jgi:acyl dehydratase